MKCGRKNFARNHNINIDKDKMTVQEFINLTENDFGGEIIKKLNKSLNLDNICFSKAKKIK